jgi:hypothetical protein
VRHHGDVTVTAAIGSPAERVRLAVERWGPSTVVQRCAVLMTHRDPLVDRDLIDLALVLGGRTDPDWLSSGKPPGHAYWARVWAARALLYVWDDSAEPAIITAMGDDEWRVREMAAKVARRREVGASADRLTELSNDDVDRVRIAVARALGRVGEGEHAEALMVLADDPEPAVARAATSALEELSLRLDRAFRR